MLYQAHRDLPAVQLKRELWAKLLTTALGTAFSDDDRLFIEHTLLVTTAKIIAHAVVGIDPADPSVSPAVLARGGLFAQAQITGVVDHDFFDWVVEVAGGRQWVRTLARRLARFAWGQVEHDVMKVLYESVISTSERHRLGEYYTPDWLAEEIVSQVVTEPLTQRVLDPGCGSGTFLFHAVRRYLHAAAAAGTANADAVLGVISHVTGVDVHPVAVTFARVTYLLAIGMDRLQAADRPPIAIPVYLGDSVQWGHGETLMHADGLSIPTDDGISPLGRRPAVPRTAARRRRPLRPARLRAGRPGRGPGTGRACPLAGRRVPALRRQSRRPAGRRADLRDHVPPARRGPQPHLGLLRAQPRPSRLAGAAREPRGRAGRQPAMAGLPVHARRHASLVPGTQRQP